MCKPQRFFALGIVLVLVLTLTGCSKKKKDTAPEPQGNPLRIDPAGGAPAQGVVRRGGQRQVNQALLRNFGQFYQAYKTDDPNGRPPRTVQEFRNYLVRDPNTRNMVAAIDKGWVVFLLDPPPSANQVLAYEKEAFAQFNNRIVLLGDGSVKLMVDSEFQAALKGQ